MQSGEINEEENKLFQTGLENLHRLKKRISGLKKDFEERLKVIENMAKVIIKIKDLAKDRPEGLEVGIGQENASLVKSNVLSSFTGTTKTSSENIPKLAQISQSNSPSVLPISSPTEGGPGL
jgi:hypothetical protein